MAIQYCQAISLLEIPGKLGLHFIFADRFALTINSSLELEGVGGHLTCEIIRCDHIGTSRLVIQDQRLVSVYRNNTK